MWVVGVVVCLSLRMANVAGSRRTQCCSICYISIADNCFVLFALFFTQWLIYQFSFHIDIIYIFKPLFSIEPIYVVAKIEMHVKIGDILYRVTKRDNSKQNRKEYCKFECNYSFAIFGKSTRERCLFLFFHLTIVYHGF